MRLYSRSSLLWSHCIKYHVRYESRRRRRLADLIGFYNAVMPSAVIATADLSFCPSVRHVPVICPEE